MRIHITLLSFIFFLGVTSVYAEIDDTSLKTWLLNGFIGTECTHGITRPELDCFRKQFSVADEQLYRVLMGIYQETDNTLQSDTPDARQKRNNIESGVVYLLSECGNIPVKDFLLDYATSQEKNPKAREFAVASYLRIANAAESKSILLRFLVKDERMEPINRNGLYCFAREVYENSVSLEKKRAILDALTTAAEREEDHTQFTQVDRILSEKNETYRHSSKRLAMFKRYNMEPPLDTTWMINKYMIFGGIVMLFLLGFCAYVWWIREK